MDDQAFIEAVRGGDPDAFRRLVEREVDGLFRLAFRILGDRGEAEDVVQETFVTAYRSVASFRGEGALGAWLRTIATRIAGRRGARRPQVDPLPDDLNQADPAQAAPLATVVSAELGQAIRRAIRSLPEAQREVVVLRLFGELTLPEIAAATGRPLATCKSHLRRGLARLRRVLRNEVAA